MNLKPERAGIKTNSFEAHHIKNNGKNINLFFPNRVIIVE